MKKTIAIISFSEIISDSRVKRQIEILKDNFKVITDSFDKENDEFYYAKKYSEKLNCKLKK